MILKSKGVSVDIQTAANLVGDATIVSVINTNTAPVLIVNSNGNNLWIAAGERVLIKKSTTKLSKQPQVQLLKFGQHP